MEREEVVDGPIRATLEELQVFTPPSPFRFPSDLLQSMAQIAINLGYASPFDFFAVVFARILQVPSNNQNYAALFRYLESRGTVPTRDQFDNVMSNFAGASNGGVANAHLLPRQGYVGGSGDHCPLCHDDFEQDQELVVLPCGHLFHASSDNCLGPSAGTVLTWFRDHSTCPMCKTTVQAPDAFESVSSQDHSPFSHVLPPPPVPEPLRSDAEPQPPLSAGDHLVIDLTWVDEDEVIDLTI